MEVLRLNHQTIQPGDVILTGEKSKISKLIQYGTQGEFSHAILYLGNYSLAEATLEGVHISNSLRKKFDPQSNVAIFRHKKGLKESEIEAICNWARMNYAAQYNVRGAIAAGIGQNYDTESKKTFCSRLACEAYFRGGYPIVENYNIATPVDISKSRELYRIDSPLVQGLDFEDDSQPNQNEMQQELVNKLMNKVRNITGDKVQSLNDVDTFVLQNPALDHTISDLFIQSGYFEMWTWDVKTCPFHYDLDQLREKINYWGFGQNDLERYCENEVHASDIGVALYTHNLRECEHILSMKKSGYFTLKRNLYLTLIQQCEIRKKVATESKKMGYNSENQH
jgi:hypothetical protein